MGGRQKYRNTPCVDEEGERFASKREMARWAELRLLERAGKLSNLRRQVRIELVPATEAGGRAMYYVADFTYTEDGKIVVEDSKSGVATPEYRLKAKVFAWRYGFAIRETK